MWPGQPDRLLPPGPEELEALLLPPALVLALGLSRVISPMEKGHLVTVHSTVTACSSLYYMVHCASASERAIFNLIFYSSSASVAFRLI